MAKYIAEIYGYYDGESTSLRCFPVASARPDDVVTTKCDVFCVYDGYGSFVAALFSSREEAERACEGRVRRNQFVSIRAARGKNLWEGIDVIVGEEAEEAIRKIEEEAAADFEASLPRRGAS